ncbi:MAG: hypothetical protein ACM31O_03670 [Bacteroidota bacterium]
MFSDELKHQLARALVPYAGQIQSQAHAKSVIRNRLRDIDEIERQLMLRGYTLAPPQARLDEATVSRAG